MPRLPLWTVRWLCAGFILMAIFLPGPVSAQQLPEDTPITPNAVDIVGGGPADPGEWPWQVYVQVGPFQCGGVLIHPRWVLTAAHCIGDTPVEYELPANITVILGAHNLLDTDGAEQERAVVQVVVHPNWDTPVNDNDIALLKLDLPVVLNSRVQTIDWLRLGVNENLAAPGTLATVTGWGRTTQGGSAATVLQEVQLPIVDNATCDAAMLADITGNMLCAGYVEGGQDSCQGDSGGPLVVPDGSNGWKLAGLVSFGVGCAQPNKYGVYARLTSYTAWIEQYLTSAEGPVVPRNANFDLGRNGEWLESSTHAFPLIADTGLPVTPRSGAFAAWLGGDNQEISVLRQTISLSDRATVLRFYYQIRSQEVTCLLDYGSVRINGQPIRPPLPLCPSSVTADWVEITVDISQYAGRTVELAFIAETNSIAPSSLLIDDISILVDAPPLALTGFTPPTARRASIVALTGSGFLDVTAVHFNGVPAAFTVASDTSLSATVPAGATSGTITVQTAYSTVVSAAAFTVLQPLTIAFQGSGSGTVTSAPAGITCGSDCTEDYPHATLVTLTAQPGPGSTFDGWSGACTGITGDCVVTLDAARTVTATFIHQEVTLAVAKHGSGTIVSSPGGINCGAACSQSYPALTVVTLTAQPAADTNFVGWSGHCAGANPTCTLTLDAAKQVTGTFAVKTFALTVTKHGTGSGTVTANLGGIACGADCTKSYAVGTAVQLTAHPAAGSVFSGWSGACTGTQPTCAVIIGSAVEVGAGFAPAPTRALFLPLIP